MTAPPSSSQRRPAPARYQAFYCEENVWWQVREGEGTRWALFITNARRRVMLWEQRLAPDGEPVLWDYHVVSLHEADGKRWVHDLDSRLPRPCLADAYLARTFPFETSDLPEPVAALGPRFRLVPAEALLRTFATDRSHMLRTDGTYIHPPPPWPKPMATELDQASTLDRYLNLEDGIAGRVMGLAEMRAWAVER